MKKNEKIRRKMVRDFAWYHGPLIAASRYVMRETEGMFQSIYMDIKGYWRCYSASICYSERKNIPFIP